MTKHQSKQKHPQIIEIHNKLEDLMLSCGTGESGGLFIYGRSGAGKSRMAQKFLQMHPHKSLLEKEVFPIIKADCPTPFSVKALTSDFLKIYGYPDYLRGTTWQLRDRLINCITKCETRLIIIDEIQHIIESRNGIANGRTVQNIDYIKQLSNAVRVPIVIVGTEEALPVFSANFQIMRRFKRKIHLELLDNGIQFRSILHKIEKALPLIKSSGLATPMMAGEIWKITRGIISNVVDLLQKSAIQAIQNQDERITIELLHKCKEDAVVQIDGKVADNYLFGAYGNKTSDRALHAA